MSCQLQLLMGTHNGLPRFDTGKSITGPRANIVIGRDAHEDIRSIISTAMDAGIGDASTGLIGACSPPLINIIPGQTLSMGPFRCHG